MGWLAYLPLNPVGTPAPYTTKVISLKAKEIQPTRPPEAPSRCSLRSLHSALPLTGLTTLIKAPTFLSLTLEEKKKQLSELHHSDSLGCCICHPPTNYTSSRELRNWGEIMLSLTCPEPDIWSQLWSASGSDGVHGYGSDKISHITHYYCICYKPLQYLSLTVQLFVPLVSWKTSSQYTTP